MYAADVVDSPYGWYQGPDGKWYPGPRTSVGGPSFPDTSSWSRSKKLRVGLTIIGIAQIIAAAGSLIYTISISARFNYPGAATFGTVIGELASAVMGAALVWIAREYLQEQ